MKTSKIIALILALALSVCAFAGCGGGSASSQSSAAPAAPSDASAASTTEGAETAPADGPVKPGNFPKKEITLIVPFAAGGAFDVMARTIQPVLKSQYDVDIIVKCVSGGGSAVGITECLTSKPDGYTIAFGSTSFLGLIAQGRMEANVEDGEYLCSISSDPMVLVGKIGGKYETAQDYIDAALAAPGTVTLANPGTNNTNQASSVFLDMAVGEGTFQLMPFSDGDARVITELLGGHSDAGVLKPNSCMSQLQSGELQLLATFTKERLESFPDVPTFKELGYDVFPYGNVAQTVCFAMAPAGLDPEIKAYLTEIIYGATQSPEFQKLAAEGAFDAPGIHGEELEAYIAELYMGAEVLAEKVFAD